jgi:hypothetical protein
MPESPDFFLSYRQRTNCPAVPKKSSGIFDRLWDKKEFIILNDKKNACLILS